MSSVLGSIRRNWLLLRPPSQPKHDDALKFGILGAANIAPMSLIVPAKSHPEVIIYAVAARDKVRGAAYAKKHGIPHVFDSYQALIDDPAIDAVYIPLPNGLHFEWAHRALAKGKHVLLEKPSTGNAIEAELLFRSPLLQVDASQPNSKPPVLLEAFHFRFSPAWAYFKSQIDQPNVSHVSTVFYLPHVIFNKDDIRFNYELAGGALMDVGSYALNSMRDVFGVEPETCDEAEVERMPAPLDKCDAGFKAKYTFPGGRLGEAEGGLRGALTSASFPTIIVTHSPVPVENADGGDAVETTRTRKITLVNFVIPGLYHRIDIEDEFITKNKETGEVVKKSVKKESKKAYTFQEAGINQPSEVYWHTYRHMLEQFVHKVRGRQTENGAWVTHEDSLAQMKLIDLTYEKSGLGVRPTSEYRPDNV